MSDKCARCGAWTENAVSKYGSFLSGETIDDVCECDTDEDDDQ